MKYILTTSQMLRAEQNAVERGETFASLMEKAGTACARIIYEEYCSRPRNILVISGKGKNGGDGFVIARILAEKGCSVKVLLPHGKPRDEISADNYRLLDEKNIFETADYMPLIREADIIVDALFGTGFSGAIEGETAALVNAVNISGKPVISVDVPSGAVCDSAQISGACFCASLTVAISALKPIHIIKPACEVCGTVRTADIGITAEDMKNNDGTLKVCLEKDDIHLMLPDRPSVSNKGTFGNALCVCGSRNMPGAAKMASRAAVHSGAGLVTLAFPDAAYQAIAPSVLEQVIVPCPSDSQGGFSFSAYEIICEKMKKASALLAGCGAGMSPETARLMRKIISHSAVPSVIDADALNALSEDLSVLSRTQAPVVLTPHPGEMSRLTGKSIEEITADPVTCAKEFADRYGCTVVLKGANTVTAAAGRSEVYVNAGGNSGLAKGGSGDLLSGIIVSLAAQGMDISDAAAAGVFIHADCADELADALSERGMSAENILEYLPLYLREYEQ